MNKFSKGIVFYDVSQPIYKPYQKLKSPIIRAIGKRIKIDDKMLLNLEFLQEDGTDIESFSFELSFSKKNIECELGKLFKSFHLRL